MFNGNYYSAGKSAQPTRVNSRRSGSRSAKRQSPSQHRRGARSEAKRGVSLQRDPADALALLPSEPVAVTGVQSAPVAAPVTEIPKPPEGATSALAAYLRSVGEVDLLTPEEEVALAARIKKGDMAAREHMIRANLRLVIKIARDYEHLGLPLLDLISEGTIGLMKAVERFDPKKGGKLSTYGSWWIKQQIRRALANQGRTIRLPVHVEAKIYRLGRAEARLREELGREASDEELAGELGIHTRKISRLRDSSIRPSSLDASLGEDDSSSVLEVVRDEKARTPSEDFEQKFDHGMIRELLRHLPEREARILTKRFGLDGEDELTLEELGAQFGLTRERIRQLQNEAFKKLRHMLEQPPTVPMAA